MLNLTGYHLNEKLYQSANSLVYRARRESDKQSVIVKVLTEDYPSPEKIAWFKREYEVTRNLSLAGVVDVYDFIHLERWVIVLEDFGGDSLARLGRVPSGVKSLSLADFLELAIKVTDVLGQIHAHHIIHKDINPANIVLNPATGEVKIIDFGISTVLSRENPTFCNANVLEGTLAYISPEQTGRMNRAMDYRSDFYSLGVTFYEWLTGQLPFVSLDALELVHAHIAKQAVPPHQLASIPSIVADIVMKLMAKNAEERYQSAYGLLADLEECQRQLHNRAQLVPFALGQRDISDRFQIPQKLYGRTEEIATLLAGFERVSAGKSEMMLVAGYSGIGKSALVQEVYKPITERRGYFISGKFDQFQRHIPYSALIQAFQSLMRQLLSESALSAWQEKLKAALGPNGQVIIDVIPEVELIIGPQPDVPELGPLAAQNRFNFVFQNFIQLFTQPEHPLVIFLDDLQWADGASLKLLELLMTSVDSRHLFVIGAYRDNEVSAAHPLMLTLNEIQKAGATVNQIVLSPLDLPQVTQLIADTLSSLEVKPLGKEVQEKTGGNPFFVTEFLKSLVAERLMIFDYQQGQWQWNLAQIRAQEITDNVVELMAGKVKKLHPETQAVLKLAACVGNQFNLQTLAVVYEKRAVETAADLEAAISEGLLVPLSDAYKLVEFEVEALVTEYKFAHDRVQQAVYSLIPEADKQTTHWQIGQLLLQKMPQEAKISAGQLFEMVNQLNQGRLLSSSQSRRNELAELNLMAGQKAKAALAYGPAVEYLKVGRGLLAADSWQSEYELTLTLYQEMAETAYLNGEFELAQMLIEEVLQQAKTLLEKVKVYELQFRFYAAQSQFQATIDSGLQVLSMLGVSLSQSAPQDFTIAELYHLPQMSAPDKLAAMRILMNLVPSVFFANPTLLRPIVFTMIRLCINEGNSPLATYAYVMYGMLLCAKGDIEAGYQFGQLALGMLEQFEVREIKCKVETVFNLSIRHWKEPATEAITALRESIQVGLATGDLAYASYDVISYCTTIFLVGEPLEAVLKKQLPYLELLQKLQQEHSLLVTKIWAQLVLNLRRDQSKQRLIGELFNEVEILPIFRETNNANALFQLHLANTQLSYLFQDYASAVANATSAEKYKGSSIGFLRYTLHNFYYSLALLALYPTAKSSQQLDSLAKVTANQQEMKLWADHAPMNFQHKYDLVEAEKARVLGQNWPAASAYERAIQGARENQYLHEEALAYELAAKFYLAQSMEEMAQLYMTKAHYAYTRWQATAKVKELEERYPQWLTKPSSKRLTTAKTIALTATGLKSSEVLDLATVMKASQAISGEIVLETLLSKMMKIVIENAGAQKGYLILPKKEKWFIEAEGAVDETKIKVLQSRATARDCLSNAIVNYVIHTKESVVLNDAVNEGQFTNDSYIKAKQPKSVLCTPLLNTGQLTGILYLENNLTTGAFTPDRLEVLNLLSAQAAISIENATLVNTLEQKVEERTLKLQHEIVERKQAEQAAKQANQAKSTFLANMSHELRTPLNAILGFSQIMTRSQTLTGENQEYMGIISRSGEHLLTLINNVLDFSKIEAGKSTLNEISFDLYRLLDDLEEMFHLKADDKHLQLLFDCTPHVPRYVRTDAVKLRQVLINLTSNALKFTEEGGVFLRVSCQELAPVPPTLTFEVEDTGAGIAPEELEHLFEAFVQTETGKRAQEGTGLGLPISRQFVQLMGGEMSVDSEVGRGTTFKFDIQIKVASASDIQRPKSRRMIALEPNQTCYRILIVDDKWSNRQLLVTLLNPLGFSIKQACNGQEAIDIWEEYSPHLIWMDMRMPVMDGYEATKRIKETLKGQATAIIALTASSLEEERAVVLSAGCDDFIRKPFRDTDIFDIMSKHIGVRYIYEDSRDEISTRVPDLLTPTALAALPAELLANLEEAILDLNIELIDSTVDEIRRHDPALGDALALLADEFEFEEILALIEKAKEQVGQRPSPL